MTKKQITKYNKADKEAIAAAFIVTGTIREAAATLGFPEQTVYAWTRKPWWKPLLEDVRFKHQEYLEAKMSKTMELVTEALVDRLQNGDVVRTADGSTKRVPVKAHELAKILTATHKELRTMRNQPTNLTATATFDLGKLTQEFAHIAEQYKHKHVINGTTTSEDPDA